MFVYAWDCVMITWSCMQVEKSVVNKLAAAYEEGVIKKHSHVTLVVGGEGGPSAIRLQVRSLTNKQH